MFIKKNNDKLEIQFTYSPSLVSFVKTLDGRSYSPQTKSWYIPIDGSGKAIERLLKNGFKCSEEALKSSKEAERKAKEVSALSLLRDTEFKSKLPLYGFQRVGAAFLDKIKSGLLADEVGLGKTIQTLAILEKLKAERVLILCPAILKWQWEEEFKKFLPERKVQVVSGSSDVRFNQWKIQAPCVWIANYELLLRDLFVMPPSYDVIVCDEATRINNPFSKTYKALRHLIANHRFALTGTPVSNRAEELWGIINWTNPGMLGNYKQFMDKYCVKNQWGGIWGYQNMEELRERVKPFMIRRKKKEVLSELPEKIYIDVPFELSEKERELYDQLKEELLFEIEKESIDKINPISIQNTLVKMLRLRQCADSLELLGKNASSSKLEALGTILKEIMAEDRKAIVFTFFSEMANILERELKEYKPLKITGETNKRSEIVEKFNKNAQNKILILTSAGQYGLNLQAASVIIHYDFEWSLAKMIQREGRAHRIGQKSNVLIYSLMAKNTIDSYIKKVLFKKQKLSDSLLEDKITGNELREMLIYAEN